MQSSNYIINRVMVKLLSEFLLDKINFDIMIAFIGNAENLKVIMDLLCSSYETIQFEHSTCSKCDFDFVFIDRYSLLIQTRRLQWKQFCG